MIDSASEQSRFAHVALQGVPTPFATWLKTALRHLLRVSAAVPATRDAVREASKLRAWAETQRRADPRFAAELFAAADRHELQGL